MKTVNLPLLNGKMLNEMKTVFFKEIYGRRVTNDNLNSKNPECCEMLTCCFSL